MKKIYVITALTAIIFTSGIALAKDQVLEWHDDIYKLKKENTAHARLAKRAQARMMSINYDPISYGLGTLLDSALNKTSGRKFKVKSVRHLDNFFVGAIDVNGISSTFLLDVKCIPDVQGDMASVDFKKIDYMTTTRKVKPSWFFVAHDKNHCVNLRVPVNSGIDRDRLKKIEVSIFGYAQTPVKTRLVRKGSVLIRK
ncbi:MAG: hypothetical protein D6732_12475 [Methanobacteriota archaeon]|nr:MAG: hypothetical protein D6732_12475 [Euryarchaeota archaeon]